MMIGIYVLCLQFAVLLGFVNCGGTDTSPTEFAADRENATSAESNLHEVDVESGFNQEMQGYRDGSESMSDMAILDAVVGAEPHSTEQYAEKQPNAEQFVEAPNSGGEPLSEYASDVMVDASDMMESVRDELVSDVPNSSDGSAVWPQQEYITPQEVYQLVLAKEPTMLLVNVSDREFYNLGHIAGSLKIPWTELDTAYTKIDSSRNVILYCRRGVRTESAYGTLKSKGFQTLWKMSGGLEQWIQLGYPVEP